MTTQSKSDFWQQHISAWKDSDLSQAAYCQKHELKLMVSVNVVVAFKSSAL